jgi:hypothetical protein
MCGIVVQIEGACIISAEGPHLECGRGSSSARSLCPDIAAFTEVLRARGPDALENIEVSIGITSYEQPQPAACCISGLA